MFSDTAELLHLFGRHSETLYEYVYGIPFPTPTTTQATIMQFLRAWMTDHNWTIPQLVHYGTSLPFSNRLLEGALRGGRTLARTIRSEYVPSTSFYVLVEPGRLPRAATEHERTQHTVHILNEPNIHTLIREPPRTSTHVLHIDIRRHVLALQRHFGRPFFDVFARGDWCIVDDVRVNISQLTVWCWMRRFAIHEYITSTYSFCTHRMSRRRANRRADRTI